MITFKVCTAVKGPVRINWVSNSLKFREGSTILTQDVTMIDLIYCYKNQESQFAVIE